MRLASLTMRRNISWCALCHLRRYSSRVANAKVAELKQRWQPAIGLEIHAKINSQSKLFSGAGTKFAAPTNTQVAFLDASLPGTLPVINKRCVEAAVKTSLALNCNVNLVSHFDRKHYFYADLPVGYQITQQRQPIGVSGKVTYLAWPPQGGSVKEFQEKAVHITQVQLEQDSGKSLHDTESSTSLIDLNRAGVPLMEIVTEPDFQSSHDAASFIKELRLILSRLGTCDCKMSEGSLRVDASVSLHLPGEPLGTRAEVKNINSIRHIALAIDYEISRQEKLLSSGGEVLNQTRSYDPELKKTIAMRDKEKLHDYRFMPEPNLPPLRLHTDDSLRKLSVDDASQVVNVDELRRSLPTLPQRDRDILCNKYGLPLHVATVIIGEEGLLELFKELMEDNDGLETKPVSSFLMNEVIALLNKRNVQLSESNLTADKLAEILVMLKEETITKTVANKILPLLFEGSEESARKVVLERNWGPMTGSEIEKICLEIINDNPAAVKSYEKGKPKMYNVLMQKVIDKTDGVANPKIVAEYLQKHLKSTVNKH